MHADATSISYMDFYSLIFSVFKQKKWLFKIKIAWSKKNCGLPRDRSPNTAPSHSAPLSVPHEKMTQRVTGNVRVKDIFCFKNMSKMQFFAFSMWTLAIGKTGFSRSTLIRVDLVIDLVTPVFPRIQQLLCFEFCINILWMHENEVQLSFYVNIPSFCTFLNHLAHLCLKSMPI